MAEHPKDSTVVSFDGQQLRLDTAEDAQVICNELQDKLIEVLILQGNTFGIEAAEAIGLELARQTNLREAHFKDLFTSRGREEVPDALRHLLSGIRNSGAKLTLLDLSDNAIGPIGAPAVIEFLDSESCENLVKLYINNCGWGPEGSSSIAPFIGKLTNLKELVCGRSRLENKGAKTLLAALSDLRSLEVLKLNQNGMFVDGIKAVAKLLEQNVETIREIDLSDNTIKPEGAEALSIPISQAKDLRIINLSDGLLSNEGFSIICDCLSRSPSIGKLETAAFEGNELTGQKIIDLIEVAFSGCSQDFHLNLLDNEFEKEELMRLNRLNCTFTILHDEEDDGDYDEETDENDEEHEEGEISASDDESDGFVNIGETETREIAQDFVRATSAFPPNPDLAKASLVELISTGTRPNDESNFQAVQVLCEELGLIKMEATRKKKPLARDSIIYLGNNIERMPPIFRNFIEVVVKNNDDLTCAKILYS